MNPTPLGSYQHIALSDIRPSRTNPRKQFDQVALEELAQSILALGVTTAITVRPLGRSAFPGEAVQPPYTIVSGERRYRAATAAGLDVIPCVVADLDDAQAEQIQMVENLQREDLHPMEEADGYRALLAGGGLTVEDVAKQTGKSATHVGRTMRLLQLELAARQLFLANHVTLGHALVLARLTAPDQDRAMRHMLGAAGNYAKMSTMDVIEAREKNITTNSYAKHRRLIEMTEGQLRQWIAENVLLQLGKAPWSLEDAELVPEAGACTTCPKRTGSNPALFEDLTVDADVCLDAGCYATKQKAFVTLTSKVAAQAGKPLLNILAKSGHEPIGSVGTQKTKLTHGQWVVAKSGSCKDTREGILVDEPGRYSDVKAKPGELLTVCANQECKVHKHIVEQPQPARVGSVQASASKGKTKAQIEAEVAQGKQREDREKRVRTAIYDNLLEANYNGLTRNAVVILMENVNGDLSWAAERLGVVVPKAAQSWQQGSEAEKAFAEHIRTSPLSKLDYIILVLLAGEAMRFNDWDGPPNSKDSRGRLWALAEQLGVDADAIAKEIEQAAEETERAAASVAATPAKVTSKAKLTKGAQADRKKAAAKKFPAKKAAQLSNEARKRIQEAMAKRWSVARKKAAGKPDGKSAGAGERAEAR